MKKFLTLTLGVALAFGLVGCENSAPSTTPTQINEDVESGDTYDDDYGYGGMGITYGGRPGIDMGNGFVQPLDGGMMSPGYGF